MSDDHGKPLMQPPDATPELLLDQARAGDDAALGRLLELYRNYLRLMARTLISQPLRVRFDASDLVQETFLKAQHEFPGFLGSTEPELVAWLRQILVRNLTDQIKWHRAGKRDYRREEPVEVMLDRSSLTVQKALAVPISSPSAQVSRREQAVLLADALAKLPADYREVFILRNLEHIPFDQIAARMNRSPGAVRKLWARTMLSLKRLLEEPR
jgi:RNA polymerase sigma-70 factor (ECF subfamily)